MGMFMFMIYYFTNQLLQFFIVGSFYVSVKLFFTHYFSQVTASTGMFSNNQDLYNFF